MTLMRIDKFLTQVNYALSGVDGDAAPDPSDDVGRYWIDTLNRKKDEVYDDTTKNWRSAYQEGVSLGTFTPALGRVVLPLPDEFISPASDVTVVDTNGQYHYYDIIDPSEADRRVQAAYISGSNPEILTFTADVKTGDALIGGTVYMAGYFRPDDIDPDSVGVEAQYVPVDDPNWAVMSVAAQVAFNDITYEEKFDDLNGQASILWKNMVKKNRKRGRKNPKVTPTLVRRIRGVR